MSICRYDKTHGYVLRAHWPTCTGIGCPGCLPCTHDQDGAEIRHCATVHGREPHRRGCTGHLRGDQAQTCTRCVSRVRADLTALEQLTALMSIEATVQGIESEALSLAGPAADPYTFEARRVIARTAAWDRYEANLDEGALAKAFAEIPEWDRRHPVGLMRYWDMTLRKAYSEPTKLRHTLSRLIAYAFSVLERFAQDPDQDFQLFADEVRDCRQHLEAVRRDSRRPQRGAPCWLCKPDEKGAQPALVLRRGHWCDKDDCNRQHAACEPTCADEHHTSTCKPDCGISHPHDFGDRWVCPRDSSHRWSDEDYRKGVAADANTERKHA